jgi:hypothetical protein
MTYQVKKPVSKFAFQMQPAALQRGAGGRAVAIRVPPLRVAARVNTIALLVLRR